MKPQSGYSDSVSSEAAAAAAVLEEWGQHIHQAEFFSSPLAFCVRVNFVSPIMYAGWQRNFVYIDKKSSVTVAVLVSIHPQFVMMEAARERLQKLKELRKQASHANYKEVLEENERAKKPANWEKKMELYQKKLENQIEDPEKKTLNMQADQIERWERPKLEKALKPMTSKDSKEGVDRMVEDVQKKIETRGKRSRRRRFDHDADVDYINERNMKFNKKLERFYGNYTDEIKQNFERGTAI